jgi:hypothetical protein
LALASSCVFDSLPTIPCPLLEPHYQRDSANAEQAPGAGAFEAWQRHGRREYHALVIFVGMIR